MEPCRGGDLQEFVKSLEPMDALSYEQWVAKVMQHTLSALSYCHSRGVIHKDLKPENVMLFFLLSGRLPFMAGKLEDFPKVVMKDPEWPMMGGATAEAQAICKRMLQRREHERPTAQEA